MGFSRHGPRRGPARRWPLRRKRRRWSRRRSCGTSIPYCTALHVPAPDHLVFGSFSRCFGIRLLADSLQSPCTSTGTACRSVSNLLPLRSLPPLSPPAGTSSTTRSTAPSWRPARRRAATRRRRTGSRAAAAEVPVPGHAMGHAPGPSAARRLQCSPQPMCPCSCCKKGAAQLGAITG